MLKFRGSQHLRQRLICASLSGRSIRIDGIRERDEAPGLQEHEAGLLRLLEKVTSGCLVEINETGTVLRYQPGLITGCSGIVHDCGKVRSMGYFLELLVCLGLFSQQGISITLRGITNDALDPSVDVFRTVTFPMIRKLAGLEEDGPDLFLKVIRRGSAPKGGGEIQVRIPVVKRLPPVALRDEGQVKRIRGIAYTTHVSPQAANRMVDGARGLLNNLLADVFIFTDHMRGVEAGESPGFGVSLVAETTTGRLLSAEACTSAAQQGREEGSLPEDLGRLASQRLLQEVYEGGICDSSHQGLVLLFCAIGPEELNEVRLGPLTPHAVRTLRHLKAFFKVTFTIQPEPNSGTLFLRCLGAGLQNRSKRLT